MIQFNPEYNGKKVLVSEFNKKYKCENFEFSVDESGMCTISNFCEKEIVLIQNFLSLVYMFSSSIGGNLRSDEYGSYGFIINGNDSNWNEIVSKDYTVSMEAIDIKRGVIIFKYPLSLEYGDSIKYELDLGQLVIDSNFYTEATNISIAENHKKSIQRCKWVGE